MALSFNTSVKSRQTFDFRFIHMLGAFPEKAVRREEQRRPGGEVNPKEDGWGSPRPCVSSDTWLTLVTPAVELHLNSLDTLHGDLGQSAARKFLTILPGL